MNMGILINRDTKVVIQGITGREGQFWTERVLDFGTNVVAGVTPGKGGQETLGVNVYNTVGEAVEELGNIDASALYVPPGFLKDAAFEAIAEGVKLVMLLADGLPPHDTMEIKQYAKEEGAMVIGPNTPGIATVDEAMLGFIPLDLSHTYRKGEVGIISRSGTLINLIAHYIVHQGYGQSSVVGIGGDPIICTDYIRILEEFENDRDTKAIVMIGEIGGVLEEETASYIKENISKPVLAWIAGRNAPQEKTMGHAGALISMGRGTANSKIAALEKAGVSVPEVPWELGKLLDEVLS